MILLLGLTAILAQSSPPPIDAGQFQRIMRGLHEPIKDCSFVYEGGTDQVGPIGISQAAKDQSMKKFQGSYNYRIDGSAFVERYSRGSNPTFVKRTKASVLREITETVDFFPDVRVISRPVQTLNVHNSGLVNDQEGVPGRFCFLWYFRDLKDAASLGFENQGWEEVDGHRCLKIKLHLFAGPPPPGGLNPDLIYWIDLERGGHPLRFDYLEEPPKVTFRTTGVKLKQFKLPSGSTVWFPVSGIRESYNWEEKHYADQAVIRETYAVMPASVVLNQGLADSIFSVQNKQAEPKLASLAIRQQFAELQAHPQEHPKTDRKSVEERLDRRLAEADKQAMITASSPTRQAWGALQVLQVVFNVVGIALLIGILVHRMGAKA